MDGRKRIGIYGGTFDPVHRGHLQVARKTVESFGLSQLLFVPARQAPHKLERPVTSPLHRYAMLALATQNDDALFVSTFELDADDRRYTIDTLTHFKSAMPDTEIFFVMGADSWAEITTWREWRRLIETANLIVVTRPGSEIKLADDALAGNSRLADVRGMDATSIAEVLERSTGPAVYFSDAAMIDLAATSVRKAAGDGQKEELDKFVPGPVADYIVKYGLYKNSNET